MARKIIYIIGLAHSGSTVLDMLMTTSGKAVGLGQVWKVLGENVATTRGRFCSCGAPATGCEFWAPVIEQLERLTDKAPPGHRYQVVLDRVESMYGSKIAVVDSSKHAEHLSVLANEVPGVDVAILHNIKDVRPFTISILDTLARKGCRRELPEKLFYQWYRNNRASHAMAERLLGRPPVRVMYEGVCLETEAVAERLAHTLGDHYIDPNAALDCGQTHIISGNRLRLAEGKKAKQLSYDYRWLVRSEWLRPYVLMSMVRKYNEQCLRELGNLGLRQARHEGP